MDYKEQNASVDVQDLFGLCSQIQDKLQSYPDTLKIIKKQIQQFIKVNSGNVKSDRKSTIDQNQTLSLLLSAQNSVNRNTMKQSTVVDMKKSVDTPMGSDVVENQNLTSSSEIPLSERIVKQINILMEYLEQPSIIIQRIIKNFTGDPSEYLWQSNPICHALDDILARIQNLKIELESTNIPVLIQLIDDLNSYYQKERAEVIQIIEDNLLNTEIRDNLDRLTIQNTIQSLFIKDIVSVQAPFIQYSLTNTKNLTHFINENKDFEIQRIAVDMIQPCQKNIIIYLMNKLLLNNNIQPSIVLRAKELKQKKTYTYFLVTPKSDSMTNIDEFYYDQETKQIQQEGDQINNKKFVMIKQVINHVFSSLLTVPFESFLPNYAVDQDTNLYRLFNHIKAKESKNSHSGQFIHFIYNFDWQK